MNKKYLKELEALIENNDVVFINFIEYNLFLDQIRISIVTSKETVDRKYDLIIKGIIYFSDNGVLKRKLHSIYHLDTPGSKIFSILEDAKVGYTDVIQISFFSEEKNRNNSRDNGNIGLNIGCKDISDFEEVRG